MQDLKLEFSKAEQVFEQYKEILSFYDDSVKVFKDDSSLSLLGSARSNSHISSIDF
jgi:hypothetical protein